MSIALYEIAQEYESSFDHLSQVLSTENLDADSRNQLILDSLSDIEMAFEKKAINVGSFIANLKLELLGVKDAEDRISQRRKTLERQIDSLTDYLLVQCQRLNINKLSNHQLVISVRNNPPKVIIEDEDALPDEYKKQEVKTFLAKSNIANALKQGWTVPGAHLETSQRLDIR